MHRPLRKGIYAPIPTFFNEIEDVEHVHLRRQVLHLAKIGIIPALCTTFGEADHLSHEERFQIIRVCRNGLNENGMNDVPVLAGITASGTRETINFALESASAGADYAIAGAPGIYAKSLDNSSITQYFIDVAASSPIPVIIINCPSHAGGIDLESDVILDILRAAPNVCGIIFADGNMGKLSRTISTVNSAAFKADYPRKDPITDILIFNGQLDSLIPAASVGTAGTMTMLANFSPRLCLRLWRTSQQLHEDRSESLIQEAQLIQAGLGEAEFIASRHGIPGMKAILDSTMHFGAKPRRPLRSLTPEELKSCVEHTAMQNVFKFELLETMRATGGLQSPSS